MSLLSGWRNASLNVSRDSAGGSTGGSANHAGLYLDDVKFLMMGVVGPVWEIAGLITSTLSIVLLKLDRSIQSSVRIILIALAVADVLFLFCTIFCVQLDLYAIRFKLESLQPLNRVIQTPACSVVNIAEMFRNWLTVLIGIERFIATSFPLSAKRLCSTRRIWLAIGMIFLGSVLLRVPYAYRRWLRQAFNLTMVQLSENKVAEVAQSIHTNVDSYGLIIVPLIILTVLSSMIIQKINLSHSLHLDMRNEAKCANSYRSAAANKNDSDSVPLTSSSSLSKNGENGFFKKSKSTVRSTLSPVGGYSSMPSATSGMSASGTTSTNASPRSQSKNVHLQSQSRHHQRSEHRRNQVARMLLFILLLFAVFGIPQIIFVIVEYMRLSRTVRHVMVIIVWTSSMIYSNTNFFVYIACMSKYRQMLKIVVCKCAFTHKRLQRFCVEGGRSRSSTSASAGESAHSERTPIVHRSVINKPERVNGANPSPSPNQNSQSKHAARNATVVRVTARNEKEPTVTVVISSSQPNGNGKSNFDMDSNAFTDARTSLLGGVKRNSGTISDV